MNATVEATIDDAPSHEAAVGRDGDPDIDKDEASGTEEQQGVEGAEVVICQQGGDNTAWEANKVEDE